MFFICARELRPISWSYARNSAVSKCADGFDREFRSAQRKAEWNIFKWRDGFEDILPYGKIA